MRRWLTLMPLLVATPASAQTASDYFAELIKPYLGRTFSCDERRGRDVTHITFNRVDAKNYTISYKTRFVGEPKVVPITVDGNHIETQTAWLNPPDFAHVQLFPKGLRSFRTFKDGETYTNVFIIFDDPDHLREVNYYTKDDISHYLRCQAKPSSGALIKLSKEQTKAEVGDIEMLGPALGAKPDLRLPQQVAAQLLASEPQKRSGGGLGGIFGALASVVVGVFRAFEAYDGRPVNTGGSTAWQPSTPAEWAGRIQGGGAPRYSPQQQAQADELERYKMREQARLGQRQTTFAEDARARTPVRSPTKVVRNSLGDTLAADQRETDAALARQNAESEASVAAIDARRRADAEKARQASAARNAAADANAAREQASSNSAQICYSSGGPHTQEFAAQEANVEVTRQSYIASNLCSTGPVASQSMSCVVRPGMPKWRNCTISFTCQPRRIACAPGKAKQD